MANSYLIGKIENILPSSAATPRPNKDYFLTKYIYSSNGTRNCYYRTDISNSNRVSSLNNGEYLIVCLKGNCNIKSNIILMKDVITQKTTSTLPSLFSKGTVELIGGREGFYIFNWSRSISKDYYDTLYKQEKSSEGLIILCLVRTGNEILGYSCRSIVNLRRAHWGYSLKTNSTIKVIDAFSYGNNTLEDMNNRRQKGSNGSYSNGFFMDAGYYINNRLHNNENAYIIFNDNGQITVNNKTTTLTLEDVLAYGQSHSNFQIARLNAHISTEQECNEIRHYDIVPYEELVGEQTGPTNNGGGTYVSGENSEGIKQDPFGNPNYQGELHYISNYNNFNLIFVPCKDSRQGIEDFDSENIKIKLIPYGGQEQKTSNNITYYQSPISTIYAIMTNVPDGATKVDIPEPLIKSSENLSDKETLFNTLDSLLNYQTTGNYIWSSGGDTLPGNVSVNGGSMQEKIQELTKYSKYYKNRMLPCGLLILKKSYNLNASDNSTYNKQNFLKAIQDKNNFITISNYMNLLVEQRLDYKFYYYTISLNLNVQRPSSIEDLITIAPYNITSFSTFLSTINQSLQNNLFYDFNVDCDVTQERGKINLYNFQLFEAYTRGHDFIQDDYTMVRPAERNPNDLRDNSRLMDFDDNYFTYKYTGRDFDIFANQNNYFEITGAYCGLVHEKDLLLESDVTLGDTYGCQEYFIQAIKYSELNDKEEKTGNYLYKDTFKVTDFLNAVDSTKYIEEDLEIMTAKIDLLQCQYYNPTAAKVSNGWCDCSFDAKGKYNKECLYQKLGICPYRFISEKHPRRIRTLSQSKSNRFNLIQQLSKVFEFYPQFYIEFDNNGRVKLDENGRMKKHVFFMTEKGSVNYNGFRYEKNLSGISRNVDSSSLTTKMYVEGNDSELTSSGMCSIQTAADNIGRNSYLLDFSYYTKRGLLNPEQTQRDIYGIEKGDMAFLPTIGSYNKKYDELSNLITTLSGEEMSAIQAEIIVAATGITTALEERKKISQTMYQFKVKQNQREQRYSSNNSPIIVESYTVSDSYKAYLEKFREQATILWGLVEKLFFSNDYFTLFLNEKESVIVNLNDLSNVKDNIAFLINSYKDKYCKGELFWRLTLEGFEEESYVPPFTSWNNFKEKIVDTYLYPTNGLLGQYKGLFEQVKYWKTEREKILNKINDISDKFYKIYEPYIKEGTWTDSNYLTDNEYYWASVSVLSDSCKPKVDYSLNVVDISPIEIYSDDYEYELGDTTYAEDIDFFGVNKETGLPNKEKVIISELEEALDENKENKIKIQNYSTQFDDLFESITASVQSLTFNENTYRRASNFTSQQYIQQDSLQGTLNQGDLTLINSNNNNIVLDDTGTSGSGISNASSKYNLTGEGLYFSTDGGTTWDVGVGPQGINADYIKFGQLDASKIQIVDGNYIYFLWDKNGINAYRNPATSTNGLVDFARFNKYGLSLIENNHIRLRAGYEYKSAETGENLTGDYDKELPLSNQNVGFYLYNDSGKPIFKTETQSEYNNQDSDYSARLSLKGEIFATNRNLDSNSGSLSNGGVVNATFGKKLRVGYAIDDMNVVQLYNSARAKFIMQNSATSSNNSEGGTMWTAGAWKIVNSDESSSEGGDSITLKSTIVTETDESGAEKKYYSYYAYLIRNLSILNEDVPLSDYYLDEKDNTLNKGSGLKYTEYNDQIRRLELKKEITDGNEEEGKEITVNVSNLNIDEFKNTIEINGEQYSAALVDDYNSSDKYLQLNDKYYRVYNRTIKVCTNINNSANVVIEPLSLDSQSITYYNILNAGTKIFPTVANLYNYSAKFEDSFYSYWLNYEDSNELVENSTSVVTDQIGIFINNKISLDDDNTRTTISTESAQDTSLDTNNPFNDPTFYIIGDSQAAILQNNSENTFNSSYIGIQNMKILQNEETYSFSDEVKNKLAAATKIGLLIGVDNKEYERYTNGSSDNLKTDMDKTIKAIKDIATNATTFYLFSTLGIKDINYNDVQQYNEALKTAYNNNDLGVKFVSIYDETLPYAGTSVYTFDIAKTGDAIYNVFASEEYKLTPGASQDTLREENQRGLLEGFERMFAIAAQAKDSITGNPVYKNILSVLKNGSLYMGGEIEGEYGQKLNLSNIGYLPDKVRISNPNLILTGDGRIYCDWNKFFQLKDGQLQESGNSLAQALEAIIANSGSTSGGTSSYLSGYYLIDPLK